MTIALSSPQPLNTAPPAPINHTPEAHLLATVQAAGIRELAQSTSIDIRLMIADMSVGLTHQTALKAPKIGHLSRSLGEQTLVKLLVAIVSAFVHSLRVTDKPDAADIIEIAETLAKTYTHDSIKDIILALKEARTNGTKFYQACDASKIYELITAYFERRADYLNNQHLDRKAAGLSQENQTLQLFDEVSPRMLKTMALRIQADHPNAENLRLKLTITNQKANRGLISPAQAEQQRAEVLRMNQRQKRPDWSTTRK